MYTWICALFRYTCPFSDKNSGCLIHISKHFFFQFSLVTLEMFPYVRKCFSIVSVSMLAESPNR